jgi:hypothetical protein
MEGKPDTPQETGRVLRFERPGSSPLRWRRHPAGVPFAGPAHPPVQDLSKYEQVAGEADDYRHRQLTNLAAFITCSLLVVVGVWLAIKIAELRRDQDCVLAGRRNCAQLQINNNSEAPAIRDLADDRQRHRR